MNQPTPACEGRSEPYDVLLDRMPGAPEYRYALRAARAICDTCDLYDPCMLTNRDERWAKAIRGAATRGPALCGTYSGWVRHRRHGERPCGPCETARNEYQRNHRQGNAAERIDMLTAQLHHLDDMGVGATEAAEAVGKSREALRKWCGKRGLADVWASLLERDRGAA